jgi:hypothetical protein
MEGCLSSTGSSLRWQEASRCSVLDELVGCAPAWNGIVSPNHQPASAHCRIALQLRHGGVASCGRPWVIAGPTYAEAALPTAGGILILQGTDDLCRFLGDREGALALIDSGRHGRSERAADSRESAACIYRCEGLTELRPRSCLLAPCVLAAAQPASWDCGGERERGGRGVVCR